MKISKPLGGKCQRLEGDVAETKQISLTLKLVRNRILIFKAQTLACYYVYRNSKDAFI